MSVLALNRIRILEEKVAAIEGLMSPIQMRLMQDILAKFDKEKTQACEERPHTLSLKKQKADSSHA